MFFSCQKNVALLTTKCSTICKQSSMHHTMNDLAIATHTDCVAAEPLMFALPSCVHSGGLRGRFLILFTAAFSYSSFFLSFSYAPSPSSSPKQCSSPSRPRSDTNIISLGPSPHHHGRNVTTRPGDCVRQAGHGGGVAVARAA